MTNEELRAIQITTEEAGKLISDDFEVYHNPGEMVQVIDQSTKTRRTILCIPEETARKMPGQAVQIGVYFFLIEGAEALEIVTERWNIHKYGKDGQAYTLAKDGETWLENDEAEGEAWSGTEEEAEMQGLIVASKDGEGAEEIYISANELEEAIILDRFEAKGPRGKWAD